MAPTQIRLTAAKSQSAASAAEPCRKAMLVRLRSELKTNAYSSLTHMRVDSQGVGAADFVAHKRHDDDKRSPAAFLHTGWITKKGDIIHNWKRRFFVLTAEHDLYYYTEETDVKNGVVALGIIFTRDITRIDKMTAADHPTPWGFYVRDSGSVIVTDCVRLSSSNSRETMWAGRYS